MANDAHKARLHRIAVFCGSSAECNPEFLKSAYDVGAALALRQMGIVFGGSSQGLMGALADGALQAGGDVVGVITRGLVAAEVAHDGLTAQHIVETLHSRQDLMHGMSDAYLILPGGLGTLAEFFEVFSWKHLEL